MALVGKAAGPRGATETFEDDGDYGGVRMAAKTTHREGKDAVIFLITAVTYDDVSDDARALPEAVETALASKKASGS